MGVAYPEGSSLTHRKPPILIPHPTKVFAQESLVTSLWRLKVHGAAERSAGFHKIDTTEPKREENQIISVIF